MATPDDQPANPLQQPNSSLPQYPEMIMAAIEELSEKGGSTKTDISRQIEAAHGGQLTSTHGTLLTHYLDKMKQSGQLVLIGHRYRSTSWSEIGEMAMFKVSRVETTPFEGQKPGTSGLRKKLKLVPVQTPIRIC
nr:HMG-Y-related protein B [Ipomoea trifida]